MADVLEQSEVDALLQAVADGGVAEESPDTPQDAPAPEEQPHEIRAYDFKRPERVSKDQELALEGLHERFARSFGAALSAYLRTIIEVKVRSTEQLTFAEFTYSLPVPTFFSLLRCSPLEGEICLELSPLIIYPIIDRMLGGGNADLYVPQRPLTQIEQRLAHRIIERALEALTESWSNIAEIEFTVAQTESNPQLVQVVAPNEVAIVIGFEIKMGNRAGSMNLCLPFNVIEPIMGRLTSQDWFAQRKKGTCEDRRDSLLENISDARLHLRAYLAQTTIKLSELLTLEVGDIIKTKKEASDDLILQIEGKSKFAGRPGQFRGRRAFRITRLAQPDENI